MPNTKNLRDALARHASVSLGHHPTAIDNLPRLGGKLGISLRVKRDDCNGLAFGGNKVRQLEYYLGPAVAAGCDTVLITGAVQSNFVRLAIAAANRLGMAAHVQLEDRVPGGDGLYHASGNILLDQLLGATLHYFPEGEDEAAADAALDGLADNLRTEGRKPFVVHLGLEHPPVGGLGYAAAAAEIIDQLQGELGSGNVGLPDVVVLASGSGLTHAGLLVGARAAGWSVPIIGICVRRSTDVQAARIMRRAEEIVELLGGEIEISRDDVIVSDRVLAPGYGRMNKAVADAIGDAARLEALLLDPVYTGRAMAGLIEAVQTGGIVEGADVFFLHTGGAPGLFAYQDVMAKALAQVRPVFS